MKLDFKSAVAGHVLLGALLFTPQANAVPVIVTDNFDGITQTGDVIVLPSGLKVLTSPTQSACIAGGVAANCDPTQPIGFEFIGLPGGEAVLESITYENYNLSTLLIGLPAASGSSNITILLPTSPNPGVFLTFNTAGTSLDGIPLHAVIGTSGTVDQITYTYDNGVPPGGAVPEPTTLALVGLGLIGFVALRRQRNGSADEGTAHNTTMTAIPEEGNVVNLFSVSEPVENHSLQKGYAEQLTFDRAA